MTPQHLAHSPRQQAAPRASSLRSTIWPTRSLVGTQRWFDELYVWTEGSAASTTQRAKMQLNALNDAFQWLEFDLVERVGVTLSFGTVETALDPLTEIFERNLLFAHRMFVMFRGAPQRLRSRYRLRGFADMLRGMRFPVGYRISAPRVSMELAGVDLVQPMFAKVLATSSPRPDAWNDLALELRALSLDTRSTIVAGVETRYQRTAASQSGFDFGQGRSIRMPYSPPIVPPSSR